ncbi:MAG: Enoyl-CoA hydratase/carnithine racemase [Dehalococcoidales bacterium]|nr:Enoyl-CoA hydratase/carnithine racemase [Dehalococcoidales bacterium]
MTYGDLLLEKEGHVAIITLNAPEKLNAFTAKMRVSLPLAVDEIARDDEVRVVILTGAGRGFCTGADVSGMSTRATSPAQISRYTLLQRTGWPFASLFPQLSKPVIAAINGPCAGAGFSLALSCDIRIAAEAARFSSIFVLRGLVPDTAMSFFLPRVVGLSKALELMFTGELITAAEAERLGIVSRVVTDGELMKAARELANRLAQQPPIPVALTKQMVWNSMIAEIHHQLDLETAGQQICWLTEDHKEAVRAFMERRPLPQFKGR